LFEPGEEGVEWQVIAALFTVQMQVPATFAQPIKPGVKQKGPGTAFMAAFSAQRMGYGG
jgi:hypothetical protein